MGYAFALFMSVGMCAMMISFNHNDVIDSYKRELKYNKYFVKQRPLNYKGKLNYV